MESKQCVVVAGVVVLLLFVITQGPSVAEARKLPREFMQCNRSASNETLNECMKTAISGAIRAMKNGLPPYGVLPIDPLAMTFISIQQGGNRPINVRIDLSNATLSGLSKIDVRAVESDVNHRAFNIYVSNPELILEGDYNMDGKFLLLPLKGKGKSKMVLSNFEAKIILRADGVPGKDGDLVWNLNDLPIDISHDVGHFQVNFENLFNGDKLLGESTNRVLNDNWEGFWAELEPALEDTFAEVFRTIINVFFAHVPEKLLFSS